MKKDIEELTVAEMKNPRKKDLDPTTKDLPSADQERKGRRHTMPHIYSAGPSIFDGLGGDETAGLEGLAFAATSTLMSREVSRDLSLSPFSRIRNDLEQFVEESERDLEARLLAPHSPRTTFGHHRSLGSMPSSPLVGPAAVVKAEARTVWVGNLEKGVEEGELRHHFGPFGGIESVRIFEGFAFVRYEEGEAAARAIDVMHGQVIGRTVIKTGPGKEPAPSAAARPVAAERNVWVGNLSEFDERRLDQVFGEYGPVEHIKLVPAKHCAFISYHDAEHAASAIRHLDGARLGEDQVRVGYAKHTNPPTSAALKIPQAAAFPRKPSTGMGLPNPSHIDMSLPGEEQTPRSMEALRSIFGSIELGVASSSAFESALFTPAPRPPRFGSLEPAVTSLLVDYGQKIPDLPQAYFGPDLTPARIRDYRRHIESHTCNPAEFDLIAMEILPVTVSASTDPVGNVLVQKLIEKGSDELKSMIIAQLAPYFAAVGIHKNGTWVVQKLINWCHQPHQQEQIAQLLQPFLVALLQDQFGNYVVQCCLQFGNGHNQFVYDGLVAECLPIATSRFGSRAMRSCLESPHATAAQQHLVAGAVLQHAPTLLLDINGVIVMQWLLDSDVPNKYHTLLPTLEEVLPSLLALRFASNLVCKLLSQTSEPEVRDRLLSILLNDMSLMQTLLAEPGSIQTVQRILAPNRPPGTIDAIKRALDSLLRSCQSPHLLKLQSDLTDPRRLSSFLQDTSTSPAPSGSSTASSQPVIISSKLKAHVHQHLHLPKDGKGGEPHLVFGTTHQLHPGKP